MITFATISKGITNVITAITNTITTTATFDWNLTNCLNFASACFCYKTFENGSRAIFASKRVFDTSHRKLLNAYKNFGQRLL